MSEDKKQGKTDRPKSKGSSSRRKKRKGMSATDRPCLEPNAAGIDIGAREIFVAAPPDRDEHPVRVFATFTEDLHAMARRLQACGVTTVAMESTGVYWIPLYDVLEAHGIRPCLTNARHMKNVPGGEPTGTNASGCSTCIPDAETIQKSLVGDWQPEHLFVLRQSCLLYRTFQQQIAECDREIEERVSAFAPRVDPLRKPLPPDRKRNRNAPKRRQKRSLPEDGFDLRTEAYKLFGVDVTRIPGIEMSALPLFSEIGRDLSTRWPLAGHFISWLDLCPDNDISGGRVLWRGTRKVQNGPVSRSAWRPTPCTAVPRLWGTTCAA